LDPTTIDATINALNPVAVNINATITHSIPSPSTINLHRQDIEKSTYA
jgi:hypothetical protein